MDQQQSQQHQILTWLRDLPPAFDPPHSILASSARRTRYSLPDGRVSKRRRLHQLTPPTSARMSSSSSKRSHSASEESRGLDPFVDGDNERTPKSKRLIPTILPWGFSSAASSISSKRSGSISPKKQARAIARTNVRTQQITASADVPATLLNLWKDIGRYDRGIGTICQTQKAAIETARETLPAFAMDTFEDFYFDPPTDEGAPDGVLRTSLGATPSVDKVAEIFEYGSHCRNSETDESGWNSWVHQKILELALGNPCSGALVTFEPCTSATILAPLADVVGRKVDFCVAIRPDAVSSLAIKSIREQDILTSISINHTDFRPLQARPIALSIETKKPGEGLANAEEQLLSWHSAQWRMLERLVGRAEPKMDLPDFLPGLIIQGHDWSFVATTKSGDQVTLWTSQHVGSTTRVTGVYQIVTVLQYLKRWIENDYWPWYKKAVLRLGDV